MNYQLMTEEQIRIISETVFIAYVEAIVDVTISMSFVRAKVTIWGVNKINISQYFE